MSEYKKMFDRMYSENRELFDNFREIHDEYALNPDKWQKIFNDYGRELTDVVRIYERKLCYNMATGKYGQFSANLSNKFWEEVKKMYPKIGFVGVKVT